ncbi:hypothetical protein RIR_jg29675.t1 [Rhizophagus irregularis DAOM 181602=DAOM 197198]|nr:hypothetical protein RIR_jg29675.t1 [Rhizophagus irregularis DAOM 181602=DAOM 197198]
MMKLNLNSASQYDCEYQLKNVNMTLKKLIMEVYRLIMKILKMSNRSSVVKSYRKWKISTNKIRMFEYLYANSLIDTRPPVLLGEQLDFPDEMKPII